MFGPEDLTESDSVSVLFQHCCKFTTMVTNFSGNGLGRTKFCLRWVMRNNGGKQTLFRMRRGGKVHKSSFTSFEGRTGGDRMVRHKGVSYNLLEQFGHLAATLINNELQ